MTQKEAITEIERLLDCAKKLQGPQTFVEFRPVPALEMALAALRPVSREQVEKVWRGEWVTKHYVDGILEGTNFDECSKCGYQRVFENPELKTKYMFCPACGAAMTDEAVDMVMEKLEGMK